MSRAEGGEQVPVATISGPDVAVIRGGTPTDDELAAITAAVTTMMAAPAEAATRQPPAWLRAALCEGVGAPAAAAPGDLDAEVVPGG